MVKESRARRRSKDAVVVVHRVLSLTMLYPTTVSIITSLCVLFVRAVDPNRADDLSHGSDLFSFVTVSGLVHCQEQQLTNTSDQRSGLLDGMSRSIAQS